LIKYWNRETGKFENEVVYGGAWVNALYQTKLGKVIADVALSRKLFSQLYGIFQSTPLSRSKIKPFISDFKIRMEEYEAGPFNTFNDFFIRKFQEGKRKFASSPDALPAFAEGRYLAFDRIDHNQKYFIKGQFLAPEAILEDRALAKQFEGGPILIARLCPTDYHRFHFPDDGQVDKSYSLTGKLHSVNPLALRHRQDIFCINERFVSILDTKNFGKLAYVEVGAMCVGMIVQSHSTEVPFKRGDEKGYFLFGASTIILMGESGNWRPDPDLVDRSMKGVETFIKLGEKIASKYS
jgi:phosphatidylserine decarboxylase